MSGGTDNPPGWRARLDERRKRLAPLSDADLLDLNRAAQASIERAEQDIRAREAELSTARRIEEETSLEYFDRQERAKWGSGA